MNALPANVKQFDVEVSTPTGPMRRFVARLIESRRRAAEIDVARYLQTADAGRTDHIHRAETRSLV